MHPVLIDHLRLVLPARDVRVQLQQVREDTRREGLLNGAVDGVVLDLRPMTGRGSAAFLHLVREVLQALRVSVRSKGRRQTTAWQRWLGPPVAGLTARRP